MKPIKIIHLYPKEMNIYGDNGNVLIIKKRLEWRKIPSRIISCSVGDKIPNDSNIIIGGGGQDAGQTIVADDLQQKSNNLKSLSKSGVPMLMVCGMYQMFGHYFNTQEGVKIPGIGILDVYTIGERGRLIGNVCSNTKWGQIVGYENHSGRTYLNGSEEFGATELKQGNNGKDKTEGAVSNNVIGTYMHGPILAKTPDFTDYLISLAITSSGQNINLGPINNDLEQLATKVAKTRPR